MDEVDTAPKVARGIDRERWGDLAHLVAIVVLVGLHASLVFLAFTHSPVDVDEGFELNVVANIVNGVGYTSDGVITATGPRDFEAGISTGPTMIVPAAGLVAAGVETVTAGRIVGVVAYLFLVAGLFVLGRRIGGRWAGLAAASSPLLLDTFTNDNSPIYGPGDLLGEYCAAAFIVWALVTVRRRPVVGFLLLGLAVVTKLIALFALPAVVVVMLLSSRRIRQITVGTWFAAGLALVGPGLLFEAVKLVVVGPSSYASLVRDFWSSAGQSRLPTHMTAEKLASLLGAWFVPSLVAILVLLAAAVVLASTASSHVTETTGRTSFARWLRSEPPALFLGSLGVAAGVVGAWMWLKFTDPTWIRHPSPGLVVGAAGMVAALVWAVRSLTSRPDALWRRTGFVTASVLAVLIGYSSLVHVADAVAPQRLGTLGAQRDLAAAIDATGTRRVQGLWGPMVPLAVMAHKPAHSIFAGVDPQSLLVFDVYPRAHLAGVGHALADAMCGDVVLRSTVILCWPAPDAQAQLDALLSQTPTGDLSEPSSQPQPSPSGP